MNILIFIHLDNAKYILCHNATLSAIIINLPFPLRLRH